MGLPVRCYRKVCLFVVVVVVVVVVVFVVVVVVVVVGGGGGVGVGGRGGVVVVYSSMKNIFKSEVFCIELIFALTYTVYDFETLSL